MIKFENTNESEVSTEGSEPIDLTRLTNSSENMSEKDFIDSTKSSENEVGLKKSRFRGKNKIDIEFITKKSRRQSTFSKRKTGLMKKAYELAELTGAEVLLMIASDTNHVYTYGTSKMKPVFESEQGKLLIEACLNDNGNIKNVEQFTKNEFVNDHCQLNHENSQHDNNLSTNQILLNINHPCIDSKILSYNGAHSSNPLKQNIFSNKMFSDLINVNNSLQTSVLVPISMPSLSTILPKK